MRLVYVCRELAVDDLASSGAEVYSLACAQARLGHVVQVLGDPPAQPRSPHSPRPVPVPLAPPREGHRYLSDAHSYADRVYDTLRALHQVDPVDAVEFVDSGGEGYTTIAAKRLLGEFDGVRLTVAAHPWAQPAPDDPPTGLADAVDRHLATYCRRNADEVVAAFPGVGRFREPVVVGGELLIDRDEPSGSALDGAAGDLGAVWFLGEPATADNPPGASGNGLETLVDALALPGAPVVPVLVRGSRPLPASLRGPGPVPIRLAGPLRRADLDRPPPAGTPCVLGLRCSPAVARLALALGLRVVAFAGSTAAGPVATAGGRVVEHGDPHAMLSGLLGHDARTVRPAAVRPRPRPRPSAPSEAARATAPAERGDLVSVLIAHRDQGEYLLAAIRSARDCGHRPIEIIVVDDGSTDPATLRTLDGLTGVTLLRGPHRGLAAARNTAVAAARGPFLVPLDADDLLPPGFVGPAVAALRRDPSIGCVGGSVRNTGLLDHVTVPLGYVPDVSLVVNTFPRATAVFRAATVTGVGGYDPTLEAYEDWDLYLRLHRAGHGVECLPVVGQIYRRHPDSMTFAHDDAARAALAQQLLLRHAGLLSDGRSLGLLLTLLDLWKRRHEPSASAVWQHTAAHGVAVVG